MEANYYLIIILSMCLVSMGLLNSILVNHKKKLSQEKRTTAKNIIRVFLVIMFLMTSGTYLKISDSATGEVGINLFLGFMFVVVFYFLISRKTYHHENYTAINNWRKTNVLEHFLDIF